MLADLTRPPDPPRLLLVATYRDDWADRSPCLSAVRADAAFAGRTELTVEPLTPGEAVALAVALGVSVAAAAGVAAQAGGNPYFVFELALAATAGAAGGVTMDELIRRRVRALPDPTRRLVEVLAVSGRPVPAKVAAAAAGADAAAAIDAKAVDLARGLGTAGEELVPYHDRVREAIFDRLTGAMRAAYHRRLAECWEAAGDADPEALADHWSGAGGAGRAAGYFAAAADRAAAALAFDRAAELYRRALEHPGPDAAALRVKRGDALASAGRGADAAGEYLTAATAGGAGEVDLRRKAASQLFISGRIDDGLEQFFAVARAVGLRFPRTPWLALVNLLFDRLRIRLAGRPAVGRLVPRAEFHPAHDACWTAALGLCMVDSIRGFAFGSRALRYAIKAGDPARLATAFGMDSAFCAATGDWRLADDRMAVAERFRDAARASNPVGGAYADGLLALARAMGHFLKSEYRASRDFALRARDIFARDCPAATWETNTADVYDVWTLMRLGEIREMSRRRRAHVAAAKQRGNYYSATIFGTYVMTYDRLAADDVAGAYDELRWAKGVWNHTGFHIQHHNLYLADAMLDLYQDEVERAYAGALKTAAVYPASKLTRIWYVRIDYMQTVGRVFVAAVGEALPGALARANREIRNLERIEHPWPAAWADTLTAGLAAVRRDDATATRHLRAAAARFAEIDMALHAAACRRQLGRLTGGEDGRALVAAADAWMAGQTVVNAERMADMLVPGFRRSG